MFVAIRKEENGSFYLYKTAYTDGRFSEEELSQAPYNFTKTFVPDECFENLTSTDFTEDLKFDIEGYNKREKSKSAKEEIRKLKDWFDIDYTYKEQKYRRLIELNRLDDDGISGTQKLQTLYETAENNRKKIQELEPFVIKQVEIKEDYDE